ncbi:hypothetical protein O181_023883 [Austropuccinia psidii MF-1]|uniref:Reverse transcriptase/retrotransposon-derived protein RNase H-like domain-containing protein n=1 Tax=Austropuccinia psidii MF-1 TaxID=1389203 RepID=A0A9Q3CJN7_9BASI|nr:hypothetical protein [Austropuccinia psidii MF-1]
MDLPPLYFHASQEEQWDEEEEPEEIETALKVVPPAYHKYFDVLSKVKAEKLCPHCACDHHIKLKGLLPPFQILKEAFTTAPILSHFNNSLPTIVETDASDYSLGALLSQVNDSGKHCIGFDSCKLLPAELKYETYDKELLVIVWALKRWRAFLLSLSSPFEVFAETSSLQYFMSSKVLTCPQLDISIDLSTVFHPETDGQTERENQNLEQYLWIYISYHQDNQHTCTYNNAEHSSTNKSPFFTIYGKNPSFDSIHISQDSPAGKLSKKTLISTASSQRRIRVSNEDIQEVCRYK